MEQTLMESEEKYRLIFEGTSEGILLIDIETRLCSYSNTSFCRMFGYSEKEIDKLRIEDLHPKEALGNVLSKLDSHKRGKNTKSQACPCLRKDGTIFYSDISGDCAIINGRKHSVKFFTDVNERKQTEAELKTLLNTSMDGYYLVDTEGHFLDTNDAYCSMIGYTRDEILKMAIKDVEALETEDVIKNRINRILETGYDRFETKHRCKNGRIIDIEASVNLLIIGQPKLFNFMRDITERKIAEAALQKEKNELKKLNNLFVDRELKMINLKKEINELLKEEGIKEKYVIHS
jgi:PAS domain S-box-containing protein